MKPSVADSFEAFRTGSRTLIATSEHLPALREAGFDEFANWDRVLVSTGSGRGASGFVELPSLGRLHLKQMRRGGIVAPLWRDRYPGRSRLMNNLEVAERAYRGGIMTPQPIALLIVEGPVGLFRGWFATRAIDGARDWWSYLRLDRQPQAEHVAAAMHSIHQMHDAGLYHADLNLGNLLLQQSPAGEWKAYVIDLDKSRFLAGPLDVGVRSRQLDRMERFFGKHLAASEGEVRKFRQQIDRGYADSKSGRS